MLITSYRFLRTSFSNSGRACFIVSLLSVSALLFAYISQYGFGLQPCSMCYYQRIPYFLSIPIGMMSWGLYHRSACLHRLMSCLLVVLCIAGAATAAYHVGIEQGVIEQTASCGSAAISDDASFEEMAAILMDTPYVACDTPQFVFLSLSMAAWNVLLSMMLAAYITYALVKDRRHKVIRPV